MQDLTVKHIQDGTTVRGSMDASQPDPQEGLVRSREARADRHFKHDLQDQRSWYSERATQFKSRAQALGIAVVAAGAATAFLQVSRDALWVLARLLFLRNVEAANVIHDVSSARVDVFWCTEADHNGIFEYWSSGVRARSLSAKL